MLSFTWRSDMRPCRFIVALQTVPQRLIKLRRGGRVQPPRERDRQNAALLLLFNVQQRSLPPSFFKPARAHARPFSA